MAENIDILTPSPDDCPYFVIDNAALAAGKALIVDSGAPIGTYRYLRRAGGYAYISAKDNFTILSMGYWLPESFTMATRPVGAGIASAISFNLVLRNSLTPATFAFISQLGQTGCQVPLENYEMPYGLFVNTTETVYNSVMGTGKFSVTFDLTGTMPYVSLIGCPALLNNTQQRIIPFIKILHNSTMFAAP